MRILVGSEDNPRRLGECIKMAATKAGLTLKELAEKIGILPSTMYQYFVASWRFPTAFCETSHT